MASGGGKPAKWTRQYEGDDDSSDDDGDRLGPGNCYDSDTDYVYSRWTNNQPDYSYGRGMVESSNANSQNYVEERRMNYRLNKQKKIFEPSFVNGNEDNTSGYNPFGLTSLPKPKSKLISIGNIPGASSNNSDVYSQKKIYETRGQMSSSSKPSTLTSSAHSKNVRRNTTEQMSRSEIVQETSPTPKKIKKVTTVTRLIDSIETAIKNGNKSFVRGDLHPLQRNTHVLRMNRRSGYANNFTMDDYMDLAPPVPFPRQPGWNPDYYSAARNEEPLPWIHQNNQYKQ